MKMDEMTHAPSRNRDMMEYESDMGYAQVQRGSVMKHESYFGKTMEK